ncbi:hypothetical protein BIW11_06510 [Tropilaelaps mercedesae]|uniref:Uncharacterized protein n=1 Tax=Tropilaelaps mercedesae TaxID=418985 RepID=A0A1V9XXU7_9ACAR|nr:hypothetical protein BIW11_06510 [Tropilaelaps mercedesae]
MNTFGASAYLKAEREAVSETLTTLKERLRKLKMEELSIRSEIRLSMSSAATGDEQNLAQPTGPGTASGSTGRVLGGGTRVWMQSIDTQQHRTSMQDQDEMSVNDAPLELDINEALRIIGRYKTERGFGGAGEECDPLFDPGGIDRDAAGEDSEYAEQVEEEEDDEDEDEDADEELKPINEDSAYRDDAREVTFDDLALERSIGEHFDEGPGTSSQLAGSGGSVYHDDERPAKMFKLDGDMFY